MTTTPTDYEIVLALLKFEGWKWYRLFQNKNFPNKKYRCLFHPLLSDAEGRLQEADMTEDVCNWAYLMNEGRVKNYTTSHDALVGVRERMSRIQQVLYVEGLRKSKRSNSSFELISATPREHALAAYEAIKDSI